MPSYEVWRQDDNGRKFRVAAWPKREEAEEQQRDLERRGHKQTYYVVTVLEEGRDLPARSGSSPV